MMKNIIMLSAVVTIIISGTANGVRPEHAGGGGGGVSMPHPPTAVSNPKWQAPNPTGLAKAIAGKKERTTTAEREQLLREKLDQQNQK